MCKVMLDSANLARIALCLSLSVVAACASTGGGNGEIGKIRYHDFDRADVDANGRLDRAEVEASFPMWAAYFDRIDSDRSEYISWSEAKVSQRPVLRAPDAPQSR